MIRKHKKYDKPRKAYDKARIEDENILVERYGLKNKREIWKADSAIDKIRRRAKGLITSSAEEQEKLISKLKENGLKVERIADVLSLSKEDYLKRRLQSVVIERFGKKPREARQLISHKHIAISGKIINIPSYVVSVDEEDKIAMVRIKTKEMAEAEKK